MSDHKKFTDEELDAIWKQMLESKSTELIHLNRSAWESCPQCEDYYSYKCCMNCGFLGSSYNKEPCKLCECASRWAPSHNFCPNCGKPLTDEAWNILEERLNRMR